METTGSGSSPSPNPNSNSSPAPTPDRASAASDLEAVANAERAVRDRPWPTWIYLTYTVFLGVLGLVPLLPDPSMTVVWVALFLGLLFFSTWAGRRLGTPLAYPTSRVFLSAVAVATLFLLTAVLVGQLDGPTWIAVVCAAGASASYGIGSLVHYRGTRR